MEEEGRKFLESILLKKMVNKKARQIVRVKRDTFLNANK